MVKKGDYGTKTLKERGMLRYVNEPGTSNPHSNTLNPGRLEERSFQILWAK